MAGHWCPGENCRTMIGPDMALCTSCAQGVEKYLEENLATLRRLAAPALADLDRLLSAHAAWERWLTEHGGNQ